MCGITGIMVPTGTDLDQATIRKMTDSIAHRGPDGDGFYFGQTVALGHRRLSIIDIEGGSQPMYCADGKVVISYNGEIYNFQHLRRELEALGHRFRTHSDTEVLLEAYMEWGKSCVTRLRGMFAFAIWDTRTRELFLARDRLGIKPLYYTLLPDGTFLFASELKGLLCHRKLRRKLRLDALEDYLTLGYVPDPKSIVDGVATLPPACTLVKKQGSPDLSVSTYWSPDLEPGTTSPNSQMDLLERLEDAVQMRLVADVPLGAFLSGGVDSSAVVAMMSKFSNDPVATCAIGSEDAAYDESGFAQAVADHFGTHHQSRLASASDGFMLQRMAEIFDEPFADMSALPTYRVSGLARKKVKVALSGDGGDELFGGYRRYRFHMMEEALRSRLPIGLRRPIFKPLAALYPKLDRAPQFLRAKSTFEALSRSSPEAYCHSVSKIPDRDRARLHSDLMKKRLGGYRAHDRFVELANEVKGADALSQVQYIDLKTYLPGDILTKVDRTSMAHSLEVRVPLLDHKFVEYALRLPADGRIVEGKGKAVFREALRGTLPDDVLDRPKKGFDVPMVSWLRGELEGEVRKLSKSTALLDTGLFDYAGIKEFGEEHISGKRDHHTSLWALLMLDKTLERLGLEI
ncbi:MAG: asparagine synthetase B [Kordiimonadales bacterium]|nr:MAG: asparagine synthetase B [Kordiimonadales bacterium]